jgi:predicted DCC family thiol-disulfide oxidoreductase YuxK
MPVGKKMRWEDALGFPLEIPRCPANLTRMGWVLFFDGDCAFCSASVQRVARLDKRGHVAFAPLQGRLAREKDFTKFAAKDGGTMVVLRESDGRIFFRSDAAIELARALGGFWRIFTLGKFFPKPLRDWMYRQVADHRYLFPAKKDACMLPTPELAARLRE